jgi:two-component sensor histidine kinase
MATFGSIVKKTLLDEADIVHLQRLISSWGMLADLCFSDLVLYVPVKRDEVEDAEEDAKDPFVPEFVVLAQVRPATAQTSIPDDLVDTKGTPDEVSFVAQGYLSEMLVFRESVSPDGGEWIVSQCIPVKRLGKVIAVIDRRHITSARLVHGELERTYLRLFEQFANMITHGEFPFEGTDIEEAPRVGDGVLVLDETKTITFMSPNAVSAMHRLGLHLIRVGDLFGQTGLRFSAPDRAFASHRPVIEEIEQRADVTLMMHAIPLLEQGNVTGALVLLRDISELRRRDRMLLSKDATIREVHHRVKNNLQTISSLLRLQARRLSSTDGQAALREAERRIRSIAVVHEILSREIGDQVSFPEIVSAIVKLAEESILPDCPVRIEVSGSAKDLDAGVATPLALVIAELLQNSIEHGFVGSQIIESGESGLIEIYLDQKDESIDMVLSDNGVGFPPEFDIRRTSSLGLLIVTDIVESQLGGTMTIGNGNGSKITLSIPV